jgi:hypothetical protein
MDIVITPITIASIKLSLPLAVKFRDIVARPAEIRITIQGEGYNRERNWLATREHGARFNLTIKGKPGFCLAALQNLIGAGRDDATAATPTELFAARVAELRYWNLRTPLRDIFQHNDMVNFEITGHSHEVKRIFPIKYSETGPKCSVYIAGKPGFAQVAASQINLNAPLLQKIVTGMLAA